MALSGTKVDTIAILSVPEAPVIASVPENAGGGINAVEAVSGGGTVVNVTLPTDAVAG